MNNGFQMELFSRNHGKTFAEVESHLMSENTQSSRSGPVPFLIAVFEYVF